jgi:putative hydrolase of the HAD superfamily
MGNPKPHVVFDLDDTLYVELDYVFSAFEFVGQMVSRLYGVTSAAKELRRLHSAGDTAPLQSYWLDKALPADALGDCIAAMRAHCPNIRLREDARALIATLDSIGIPWSILTDGRSVTQRQKIIALGLNEASRSIYISQERGVSKPALAAFTQIERDFSEIGRFFYVADNPAKDFLAPNKLGWMTIMLSDSGSNIHKQDIALLDAGKAKETIETLLELLQFLDTDNSTYGHSAIDRAN